MISMQTVRPFRFASVPVNARLNEGACACLPIGWVACLPDGLTALPFFLLHPFFTA